MGFDCMEMDQMVTSRVAPGMAVSGGGGLTWKSLLQLQEPEYELWENA